MSSRDCILVTGGAGFVGGHFARAAHEAGSRVVILDDLSAGTPPPKGIELVQGDIADRALVARLIEQHRVTAVVHFAGKICVGESVTKPALYFDGNLTRSLALIDTVIAHGPKTFLFSSTAAVYGSPETTPIVEHSRLAPINPYGASKLGIEYVLEAYGRAYGLRWAALRYFNAAGAHPDGTMSERHEPETHLIPLAIDAALGRRGPLTVFGNDYETRDGTCIRDYIHVCDLADAHLAALSALDRGIAVGATNLGSANGFSVLEVIEETARLVGRPVPHTIGARREGDPPVLLASNARARELLGWRPRCSDLATVLGDAVRSRR